jgi:hypothetical protein
MELVSSGLNLKTVSHHGDVTDEHCVNIVTFPFIA